MGLNYTGSSRIGEHGLIHDWCVSWVLCHWTQKILIKFQQISTFKKIYGFYLWLLPILGVRPLFVYNSLLIFSPIKVHFFFIQTWEPLVEWWTCAKFNITFNTSLWILCVIDTSHITMKPYAPSHIVLGLCKICYLKLKYHPSWRYMAKLVTLNGIVKGNQIHKVCWLPWYLRCTID
jgi:hypothetical protein